MTGTSATGVSLCDGSTHMASASIEGGMRQSETVFSMIEQVLALSGAKIDSVEGIAVLKGPGSYTGLRVGFAAAKAIAYSLGVPILPVDTCDAIFATAAVDAPVMALLDARRGRFYAKSFAADGTVLLPTTVLEAEALPCGGKEVYALGEGLSRHRDWLRERGYRAPLNRDVFLRVEGLERAALALSPEDYVGPDHDVLNYLKTNEDVPCRQKG